MDDDYIPLEGYFEALCVEINALDPKSADFDFYLKNARIAIEQSPFLTQAERKSARAMLHLVMVHSH